jgi:hypothetical protein
MSVFGLHMYFALPLFLDLFQHINRLRKFFTICGIYRRLEGLVDNIREERFGFGVTWFRGMIAF